MLHRNISRVLSALVLSAGAAMSVAGCPAGDACTVGADCPSGACRADGSCTPPSEGSSTGPGDSSSDSSGSLDEADTTATDDGSGDGTGGQLCLPPNGDGLIERDEMPLEPGLAATFLIAQDVAFDSSGTMLDGGRQWDFDVELTGDQQAIAETLPLAGRWFEPVFPGATYATRLADGDDLLGVFEATDTALLLRGVVSPADGLTRTELVYDPPATVLSFPLFADQSWTTESTVSGLAQGIAAFYTERYEGRVDAQGTAITPFGEFPVLRANVLLTRTIGVIPTTVRTQSFIAECFGTVAALRSNEGIESPELTQAAEVRRLIP